MHHPNIVSPYAWAADDGMVLIASELIDGGSLQVLLGDYGALAERAVVEIVVQVLSALDAVHTAELIHRDVKPGNLLLRATGNGPLRVMPADFGLTISRRDARLTAVGMVIGTPGYLPPEVLLGGASPEPAHDMYAVGRLALTLLTGHEVRAAEQDHVLITDPILRDLVHSLVATDPTQVPRSIPPCQPAHRRPQTPPCASVTAVAGSPRVIGAARPMANSSALSMVARTDGSPRPVDGPGPASTAPLTTTAWPPR